MTTPQSTTATLVKALTAASFGLGAAEILAPDRLAALAGVDDSPRAPLVIRAFGLRECATGVGLMAGPPTLMWARVAGDALDLGLLLVALAGRSGARRRRCGVAAAGIAAVTGVDVYTALRT